MPGGLFASDRHTDGTDFAQDDGLRPGGAVPGVAIVDARGRVCAWNATAERLTGWSASDIQGRSFPVACSDHPDTVCDSFLAGVAAASPDGFAVSILSPEGTAQAIRVWCSPIPGTDRSTVLCLPANCPRTALASNGAQAIDRSVISEPPKATPRETGAAVADSALFPEENPGAIVRIAGTGDVLYMNPAARTMLGDPSGDGDAAASFMERLRCAARQALEGDARCDVEIVSAQGRIHSFDCVPLSDRGYANLYGRDITAQKLAQEDLARERSNLQTILEAVSVGMLLADESGAVRHVNKTVSQWVGEELQTRYGGQPGDVMGCVHAVGAIGRCGHTSHCLVCPLRNTFESVMRTGQSVRGVECRMALAHGGGEIPLWLEINADPLVLEGKRHVLMALNNITERKQTEEALRESEERYRALFSEMTEGFALHEILCDENGVPCDYRFIDINPAFEVLTGLKREDVVGRTMTEVIADDDPVWIREYGKVALTGEPVHLDNFSPSLGRQYDVYAYRPAAGQFAVLFTDITDLRRAQEALREASSRLTYHVENSPLAVVEFDADFRITRWSEEAERVFGWTAAEMLGRAMLDVPWVHPDDLEAVKGVRDSMVMGSARTVSPNRNVRKDGSVIWCEWYNSSLNDGHGSLVSVLSLVLDVTKREEAQRALHESEVRFHTLADNISQLAWTTDANGRVTWFNKRWFDYTGLSPDDPLTYDRHRIHHPDHIDRVVARWERALNAGQPWEDTYPIRGRDGQYRWFLSRAFPVRDETGMVVRWFGTNTDITDRLEMEEELRRRADRLAAADRAKDDFLAMLAHELRNPLGAIGNAATLIGMQTEGRTVLRKPVEILNRQVKHTARLVDDLLDVSRITRGKMELQKEIGDLTAIAARAAETVGPQMDIYRHDFTVSLPASPVWLEGDTARLEQVIGNLLSNAAKYTDPGGHITISVAREGTDAVVRVQDDGQGIEEAMLPHVFDLFAQEDRSLARSKGGLGIGLTLVKRLVGMHQGTVEAFSGGPGTGSLFVVRLPVVDAGDRPPGGERLPAGNARKRRILVVEDNIDAATALGDILESWGHEVVVVHDGSTALEATAQHSPDFVLLDIGLPVMDGYEVARALRGRGTDENCCLVALTGYGQEADQRRSREAGFDRHLVKPVDMDLLKAALADGDHEPATGM